MYVITNEQGSVVTRGKWTARISEMMGLKGNADAPARPHTYEGWTLRDEQVIQDPAPLDYQTETQTSAGLEGDVWVIRKGVQDLTDITGFKDALLTRIDQRAETERAKYATPIWGQESVYLEKEAEAKAFTADPLSDTPYLDAESAATGTAKADLAATVLTNSAAWRAVSILIETNRMKLKAQVNAAASAADLRVVDIEAGWMS